jgi:hypothetical protein
MPETAVAPAKPTATTAPAPTYSADERQIVETMRRNGISGDELLRRASRDWQREQTDASPPEPAKKGDDIPTVADVERVAEAKIHRAELARKRDDQRAAGLAMQSKVESEVDAVLEQYPGLSGNEDLVRQVQFSVGTRLQRSPDLTDPAKTSDRAFAKAIREEAEKVIQANQAAFGAAGKLSGKEDLASRLTAQRTAGEGPGAGRTGSSTTGPVSKLFEPIVYGLGKEVFLDEDEIGELAEREANAMIAAGK